MPISACVYACIMHLWCVFALASITLVSVQTGELRTKDTAKPRSKQGPDWSEGPSKAPGGPLMELSSCHVLAVQQPPLLSHTSLVHQTHTYTQSACWSQRLSSFSSAGVSTREFKGTTVSDLYNSRTFKLSSKALNLTSCVQCSDLRNLKRSCITVYRDCYTTSLKVQIL